MIVPIPSDQPFEVSALTFDQAQEDFRAEPSCATARDYMRVAMEYEADDMIGSDTFFDALSDILAFLHAHAAE
jgi:hypothetical protein